VEKYKLSVVVPVYNEEKNIPPFLKRLKNVLQDLGCNYEIVFSMDPSTDSTEKLILESRRQDANVKLLKFSRRFGQPAATLAGIHYCTGDACVVIDADLQDPPELIKEMVAKWKEGYDVAYAQRTQREGENFFRKMVAYTAYWIINRISNVEIPRNTGDFRLISRRVMNWLKTLKEGHGFLRGLVSYVGFSQIAIPYVRDARLSGKTKYNSLFGSFTIGLNGIISFSRYPLHLISIMGLVISAFSFLLGFTYLFLKLINFNIVWGNPTLVILISFIAGIQLLSLGIMGEYVGRIYDEVKGRPIYIVSEAHGF
jgi:dolichol-phosphate mannosyltransferase